MTGSDAKLRLVSDGKICGRCKHRKPLDDFHNRSRSKDGKQDRCKACNAEIQAGHVADGRSRAWNNAANARLRDQMLEAYGERCACCGVTERVFLTLDHIDGLPPEHRHPTRRRLNPTEIQRQLRAAGWPAGYQTLCFNCNYAKHALGACPHQSVLRAVS